VTALAERTEGWIAGLQMAALSMRDRKDVRGFIAGFSGTNRYILDYLMEEVLASQPPEIQQFLMQTAILERLTAALCEAITEISERGEARNNDPAPDYLDSRAILEYLDRANLFLVPLDDERVWYRYHHLFADLLRLRLQQAQPELIPMLHIRAAEWLEQSGLINDAVEHLFAAHKIDRAADLIERYGPRRLAEGDPSVLQLGDHLPQELILARPVIALYQAWLLIMQARIAQAYPLLNALAQSSEQGWIRTFALTALAFLARPADVQGSAPLPDFSLLDDIPDEEVLLRNAADLLYGMALARRGDYDLAVEVSLSCIQRDVTQQSAQAIPSVAPFLSRLYLIHGRLHAAAALCHEFLDPLKDRGNRFVYSSGSMKIDLGEVLYEWNHLEEAEQLIRDGLLANEPWRNIMTDGFGLGALARVLMAKGDYAGALQAAEKLESRLLEHAQPREFDEDLRTLRARVQLARGDVHSASRWAEQVLLSEDFAQHQELYSLTLGRIRLAQGRYAEVERLLDGFEPPLAAGSQVRRQLEANLLLAAALAGQQRLAEALSLIDASLTLAETEGYLSVFLSVGELVRDLLAAYLRSAVPAQKAHAQSILQAYGRTGGIAQAGLIEPLSARELEVLELIAQGKTNQEIAQKLIVSPGTVKAHTASIYRKLDAANRTEAVARARQLGILS
jgi:LuxR family maltose regulon positive regulatory protein